jgi:pimeloyl-ACP methyl ester carboxylesterase
MAGAGQPVVLIPGLFGSAFSFRKLVPLLTDEQYRTVVVEPLAVGSSSRPERADYSLTAQADRIAAVLDSLRIQDAVIVAHSLGAAMGFRLAYRRPDLVRAMISLEGGPAETAATPGFRRAMQAVPWVKMMGGMKAVRKRIRSSLIEASGDTSWVTDDVVGAYSAGAARDLDATLKAYVRMAEARERERLAPRLAQIRCPVHLLIGGAKHPEKVSAKELAALHHSISVLSVDTIAGAGHHLQEERPELVAVEVHRIAQATQPAGPVLAESAR